MKNLKLWIVAVAVLSLMSIPLVSFVSATPATTNYKFATGGTCAPSSLVIGIDYCTSGVVYIQEPTIGDYVEDGEISFSVKPKSNGSFSNGTIWRVGADGLPAWTVTNWSGNNLSGTFSGFDIDDNFFSGTLTVNLSTSPSKVCLGKTGCHNVTVTRATGSGTFTQ